MDDFSLHDIADTFPTDVEQSCGSITAAVATLREQLPVLEQACAALAPAWEQIADAMHSLHGTSAMVSLNGFAALSSVAENSAEMLALETNNVLNAIPRCHEIIGATSAASESMRQAVPEFFASEQQQIEADAQLGSTAEEWENMWAAMAASNELESAEFADEMDLHSETAGDAAPSDPEAFSFGAPGENAEQAPNALGNDDTFSFASAPEAPTDNEAQADEKHVLGEPGVTALRDESLSPLPQPDSQPGDLDNGESFSFNAAADAADTAATPADSEHVFTFGAQPTETAVAPSTESEAVSEDLLDIFREEYQGVAEELNEALQAILNGYGTDEMITRAGRIFHQLKGAAASIGLHANSQAAAYGERICDDTSEARQLAHELVQLAQDINPDATQHDSLNSTDQEAMRATFLGEFTEIAKTITAWLDANTLSQHWDDALQLLHRLKGSALIVAANDLYPPISSVHDQFVHQNAQDGISTELRASLRDLFAMVDREASHAFDLPATDMPATPAEPAPATSHNEPLSDELWEVFSIECAELRGQWEQHASDLAETEQPLEELRGLMRCAHTLKIATASMSLAQIASLMGTAEDFFETHIDAQVIPPLPVLTRVATAFLTAIDDALANHGTIQPSLRDKIDAVLLECLSDDQATKPAMGMTSGQTPIDQTPTESALLESATDASASGSLSDHPSHPSNASNASNVSKPSEVASPAAADKSIRIPLQRIERLIDGMSELMVNRAKIERDIDTINSLQKSVRDTFKRLDTNMASFADQNEFSATQADEDAQFSATEWDHFDAVNIFARSLREMGSDLQEAHQLLQRGVKDLHTRNREFASGLHELQGAMGNLRTIRLQGLFNRLRLATSEAADYANKQVTVQLEGQDAQLDKVVVDRLYAPLTHVVRNAIAHAIETPEIRQEIGKNSVGTVHIRAEAKSGTVIITIADDGAGIDRASLHAKGVELGLIQANEPVDSPAVLNLIFAAGLSTRSSADELAGRGVGCDVLQREVQAAGGTVTVSSAPGAGTSFTLTLPISVAVTRVLFVEAAGQIFAIPMEHVERVMSDMTADTFDYQGRSFINRSLAGVLHLPEETQATHGLICSFGNQRTLLTVDRIIGTEEIVVRELGNFLNHHPALSGMTISADGEPVLLLDVHFFIQTEQQSADNQFAQPFATITSDVPQRQYVLIVDDSLSVRKVAERHLLAAGIDVETATDGRDALNYIRQEKPQIIFTDLEMPTMDGLSLIRRVRSDDTATPMVWSVAAAATSTEALRPKRAPMIIWRNHLIAKVC
jgi:chemosensory pili system protein ChpA (sensor histidine kinase/response regulator)